MEGITTKIPPHSCAKCGYGMDATTSAYGKGRPSEGDVSMCLNCGALAVFNKDLTLRQPTKEEQDSLNLNPSIIKAQITRASVTANKPTKKGK